MDIIYEKKFETYEINPNILNVKMTKPAKKTVVTGQNENRKPKYYPCGKYLDMIY